MRKYIYKSLIDFFVMEYVLPYILKKDRREILHSFFIPTQEIF